MVRLTCFELSKIWRKRGFLFSLCLLLALNVFLLWYTNLPGGDTPPLSAYRAAGRELAGMTEAEKYARVAEWKETVDGVAFVTEILSMRNMGDAWAGQADALLAQRPGVFEKYYDVCLSGDYLRFTGSPGQEAALIDELCGEAAKTAAYSEYLQAVRDRRNTLGGISIFAGQGGDSFSARNIEKSAADYAGLSPDGLRWSPSKPVTAAMESVWTDLLLVLLSFLFVGSLITEEKEKGLFYITRATGRGVGPAVAAKLLALLVHCMVSSILFFGVNCLFFALTAGWCDMAAPLQSLAPYLESALPVSILTYLLLSVLTKALVLFAVGTVLTAFCILSDSLIPPYLAGAALWGAGWALYRFVPAASRLGALKHLNLFALLRTERIYGAYLNLNLLGYPASRIALSWVLLGVTGGLGAVWSCLLFRRGGSLTLRRTVRRAVFPFRPHTGLVRYEGFKILLMDRALLVLLLFAALIARSELGRAYTPSVQEQYYQSLMLRLEGEPDAGKTALMEAETARYEEAFREIEEIDRAAAAGEVDEEAAEAMKTPWYSVTAFYSAFQRAEEQYQSAQETGGVCAYDTGYLYLLGVKGGGVLSDFLLLSLAVVLAFSDVMSMEDRAGAWRLLAATRTGRRGVAARKALVCALLAAVFAALPFLFRWYSVSAAFPIRGLSYPVRCLPYYAALPAWLPAGGLLAWKLLSQVCAVLILTAVVLLFSGWRKNRGQAIFFGLLILCAPVVLAALGFGLARWFSLYPWYACTFG